MTRITNLCLDALEAVGDALEAAGNRLVRLSWSLRDRSRRQPVSLTSIPDRYRAPFEPVHVDWFGREGKP